MIDYVYYDGGNDDSYYLCSDHLYNHDCPHYQKADISTIVDRLTDTSKYGGTHKVNTRKGKDSNLSLMRVKFNI